MGIEQFWLYNSREIYKVIHFKTEYDKKNKRLEGKEERERDLRVVWLNFFRKRIIDDLVIFCVKKRCTGREYNNDDNDCSAGHSIITEIKYRYRYNFII